MNELLLAAERNLAAGLPAVAERLFRQALDADPTSSIALVGLARVALELGDDVGAWRLARRAATVEPGNEAATRLADRLAEIWRYRGQDIAAAAAADEAAADEAAAAGEANGAGPGRTEEQA